MTARDLFRAAVMGAGVSAVGGLLRFFPPDFPLTRWWPWVLAAGVAVVWMALVAMVRRHPLIRLAMVGIAVVALSVWLASRHVPAMTPGRTYWPLLAAVGALITAGAVGFGLHRQSGTAGTVGFWSWRSRRNRGVASAWQIWRTASASAVRRKAAQLRPSFRDLTFWQRTRVSARELATPLARVGLFRIWSTVEDVTLRVGGPRTGKTGELGCRVLDAPGAVIATSTRTDLYELTGPVREQLGPVHVFNPSGVGDLSSSITFDPLAGCQVPKVAMTRAADLLSGVSAPGGHGEREFWEGQARRALAALMHAAALGGKSMRDVQTWVADPDQAERDVTKFLHRSPEPSTMSEAAQFLTTNERTRSSICSTVMPALGWLADPVAAASAESGVFDVERLLAERGTVYMLGAEDAQTAPLVTALTGHIAREARRIAGGKRSGRLDPPLTLALDEAALICPIPLDNWTADMGGRGVTIHIAAQSRAQLRQRWGDTGAAAILNNSATLLIYGGTRDPEDLNAYSTLTGERDEQVPTFDEWGEVRGRSVRRVPVLTAAQIAQLKERRVVIIRRGMPAAVGRVQMAWQRREVKAARRRRQWAERIDRFSQWRESVATTFGGTVDTAAVWFDEHRARREQHDAERERAHATHTVRSSHDSESWDGGEQR